MRLNNGDRQKIERVPFSPGHLDIIQMRAHEFEVLTLDGICGLAKSGECHTYIYRGRILCIAGKVDRWQGVAEVYIIPSVYVPIYAVAFQKAVKAQLNLWSEKYHRLQTASIDDDRTERWMKSLGFKSEGVLEQYAPNRINYRQWSRVKVWEPGLKVISG